MRLHSPCHVVPPSRRPLLGAGALLLVAFAHTLEEAPGTAVGSARAVVGPKECGECHEAEFAAWSTSAHERRSLAFTRDPETRRIAKALGIRRVKQDERCTRCHYTLQAEPDGGMDAIAGVSCESCHGAARDWLKIHDDFGEGETLETETDEHRDERLALCVQGGMNHPDRLTAVAATCYGCHVVDDPELLGAGHPAGEGFEIVAWSQGEIRHNYVRGQGENPEASLERRRVLYALGRMLELEFAVRALGRSGASPAVEPRLERARHELRRVADACGAPEVLEALELVAPLAAGPVIEASTPAEERPSELASRLRALAQRLEQRLDGEGLEALDSLLPTSQEYRGTAPR